MKCLLIIVSLVASLVTSGCVVQNNNPPVPLTPTPIPQNYLNCNGTWYDGDNQTCCGDDVYTTLDNFTCWQDHYKSFREIREEESFNQLLEREKKDIQELRSCYDENGRWAYYVCSDCGCIE